MQKITSEIQHKRMTESSIPKLITKLSIPTVISMLITVIYNTADTYFVSQINKSASAGVSACYSIMAIIQAIGFGFGMGAGNLISLALGEKNNDKAHKFASSAFFAAVLTGAFIGFVPQPFLKNILQFLGCSDTMLPYSLPYARYILLIAPIYCATFVLNNTLRSEGEANLAMWGFLIGGILNIILDPIFIFKMELGTKGAAIATALSETITFLILLYFFIFNKTIVKIKFNHISKKNKDYLLIITTGLPTIFRQGLGSIASALMNKCSVPYGDAAVAAVALANKVYALVRNLVIGIGQGFQPVAGYNYGAGKKKRTIEAFRFATIVGTIICILSAVIIAVFAEPIMAWFCDDAEVIKIGKPSLIYACIVMPFMAFSTYVNQLFQCLGFKAPATFLASCRQGIFFIPGILILKLIFELNGVMAAQPFSDLCTFLISIPFFIVFYNEHFKHNID